LVKEITPSGPSALLIAIHNMCGSVVRKRIFKGVKETMKILRQMWADDQGQDIAEYAVMLAVILVIVVGTIRLIGSNANNVFSNVASSLH